MWLQLHGRVPARSVRVELRAVDNMQSVRDEGNQFAHDAIKARARRSMGRVKAGGGMCWIQCWRWREVGY